MNKISKFILSASVITVLATGCVAPPPAAPQPAETPAATPAAPAEQPDSVSSASPKESADPAALVSGMSESGFWIFSVLDDVTLNQPLNVDGTFYDKDDTSSKVYRKLALYAQDSDRKVTAEYTLTVPEIIVNSPNFLIQHGTVKGNIVVNAEGFSLNNVNLEGNLAFATQALQDSAVIEDSEISGMVSVSGADAVSSASPKESSDPEALLAGLSENGYWIFSLLSDVTLDKTLNVDGTFHDKDDPAAKVYRKLALYAQDKDRNVTAEYTLTVPEIVVTSPEFLIQNGTVKGNILVNADGFVLNKTTVEGDVTFTTQAQHDSAVLDTAVITGNISVR